MLPRDPSEDIARRMAEDYIYDNLGSNIGPGDNIIGLPYGRWLLGLEVDVPVKLRLDPMHEAEFIYHINNIGYILVGKDGEQFSIVQAPKREQIEKYIQRELLKLRPKVILNRSK